MHNLFEVRGRLSVASDASTLESLAPLPHDSVMPRFVHLKNLWLALCAAMLLGFVLPTRAVILWSDLGTTRANETGPGVDILGGAVKEDDSSSNVLYFKLHVDPLSDVSVEPYFAAFQLFEQGTPRLAVGNALRAWAYSAFNTAETGDSSVADFGDVDLHSSRPERAAGEAFFPYELPRRGIESTIVFRVQYVPGQDDVVTVWLNPDLSPGATEATQKTNLTTTFRANASFDEIRLRHGGGGGGWNFSGMAIATSFNDFVNGNSNPDSQSGVTLPFTFRSWQREQGLPQNSVRALAQTRDGYLWIGSDDGVARFDGVRFVPYGSREGLRGGPVRTLLGDSRGGLWIGSAGGGLTHLEPGRSTTYTIRNGLPADSITALVEDGFGKIWVGTEAGLAVWKNGALTALGKNEPFSGRAVTALFNDAKGTMWVGIRGAGVYHHENGKFIPLPDPSAERLLLDPHCILVDRAGRMWIGAGDDRVLCREGEQWLRYRIPHHLARPYVSALVEGADGTVWAGSVSEGLFEFKQGRLTAINAGGGLADNVVESLLMDREGRLWVGTDAGLSRLRPKNLQALEQGEGLDYGPVQGLAEVARGIIWAGKPDGGLYRSDGKMFTRVNASAWLGADSQVNALLLARDGTCWVAGAHGVINFKNPANPATEAGAPALVGLNVIALAEDEEGRLWAGTRGGQLWLRQSEKWSAQPTFWQGHAVTTILQDTNGWLWIGTEGDGLHRIKGNAHEQFGKAGGGLESDLIRALYLDKEGALWIGTAGGGLSRKVNGNIKTFTTREGLPDNTISQIIEDDAGRLWLGSDRGIACVRKRDLADLAAGKVHAVYPQVYGRADGMLSEECTGGFSPAGLKTKSGPLWFPTLKGIVVADPRRMAEVPAPTVLLEEVLLDGEPLPGFPVSPLVPQTNRPTARTARSRMLTIPPGRHRLELRYTGLSFNAPERIRFRYQLEGLDADWVDAADGGTRRAASYNYVPPGDYHFRVIACNSDGVWNQNGASLSFRVLPHLWQSWWFIGLAVVLLLITVGGAVRFVEKAKIQRRLKQLEQERALQRERARIARDLHDDLGSTLTRISLLSGLTRADKDNPALVEAHAVKLSQSAALTVRALEEIVWAVRPGSDSLQSLLEYIAHFANELFEGDNARCRLVLPPQVPERPLPPEVRHDIFLIVKEALTNALKHAAAKEVRVQAKLTGDTLEILVQDDGHGFDSAVPQKSERNGLGNMRRRAEGMGGTLDIQSWPGKGTAVCLKVELPNETGNIER